MVSLSSSWPWAITRLSPPLTLRQLQDVLEVAEVIPALEGMTSWMIAAEARARRASQASLSAEVARADEQVSRPR